MASETLENESLLGVLVVLFLVIVSTIYVFTQQQQQQQHDQQRAGRPTASGLRSPVAAPHAPNAVVTSSLTESQLRLHRVLPSRYGARTVTVCLDALVQRSPIAWCSPQTPHILKELLAIADVYILCQTTSGDENGSAEMERLRDFIVDNLGNTDTTGRRLSPHRVLFCTTAIGKIAFVRQLEPQVHVDVNGTVVRELEKHVPRVVHVVAALAAPSTDVMHHVTESFATYFELLSAG
ncbi:hypothetical protein ATCC90586_005741 [Pythium insidiosum]|nr:hypothetical protein ATCC90586_005741 [Pythium insidiosum]